MKNVVMLALVASLVGCANVSGYKPVLNERAEKNAANVASDYEYCHGLANNAAGWVSDGASDALTVASGSAAIGAVSGAIISGTVSAGMGAAAGGAIGGISGLWYGLYDANETYKRSYNACMSQLGHSVVW